MGRPRIKKIGAMTATERQRKWRQTIAREKKLENPKLKEKQGRRAEREAELGAKIKALPDRRYAVILADPEWRFEQWSRETGLDRASDGHFCTSFTAIIKAPPVDTIAAKDCVLFLWATIPMFIAAHEVMADWGFEYKSHVVWAKPHIGAGHWVREKHEVLMIGTRGKVPAPASGEQWPSVINAPNGKCIRPMITIITRPLTKMIAVSTKRRKSMPRLLTDIAKPATNIRQPPTNIRTNRAELRCVTGGKKPRAGA